MNADERRERDREMAAYYAARPVNNLRVVAEAFDVTHATVRNAILRVRPGVLRSISEAKRKPAP